MHEAETYKCGRHRITEIYMFSPLRINTLNADLNPICHLLALLGAHHILHVNRIMVKAGHRKIRYEIHKLIVSIWNKKNYLQSRRRQFYTYV